MFEVGDPATELALTGLVLGFVLLLLVSLWPWPLRDGRHRWTLALPLVALAGYAFYELLMPDRFDIRIDLLLILPVIGAIVLVGIGRACLMLWRLRR